MAGQCAATAQCDRQRRGAGRRRQESKSAIWACAAPAAASLESLELEYWERRLIGEALHRTEGNVPEAARLLGIGRATLYRKIEQYGVSRSVGPSWIAMPVSRWEMCDSSIITIGPAAHREG